MLLALAMAISVAGEVIPPEISGIDEGDRAWFAGRRLEGLRAWRDVRDMTRGDPRPEARAAEAMARLRLLRGASVYAAAIHGPKVEKALEACPWENAWCRLAEVDYHLFAPNGIRDPRAAHALLDAGALAALPDREGTRRALFDGVALPTATDALGDALRDGPAWEPGPWVLGVGVRFGPPIGVGLGLHYLNRDVLRRGIWVDLDGYVAFRGYGVSGFAIGSGVVAPIVRVAGGRFPLWGADIGAYEGIDVWRVAPGVGVGRRVRVEGGPLFRTDALLGSVWAGHGAWGALGVDLRREPIFGRPLTGAAQEATERLGGAVLPGSGERAGVALLGQVEVAAPPFADGWRLGGVVELRGYTPLLAGVLATRVRVEGTLGDQPAMRLPTVGGPNVLRGARLGELRAPWTLATDIEWRRMILGPVRFAAFASGAWVDGPHGSVGVGARLMLEPRGYNTLRLDVAVSDTANGIYLVWGEAF